MSASAKPLYVLNGPNLNLLGQREPTVYGYTTLAEIEARCAAQAQALGLSIVFRQTQREGELVEWLHEAQDRGVAVVLNAAAYTHTSVALHDAVKAITIPVYEVHLSNPHAREAFRHVSYISAVAKGVIAGLGPLGYELAIQAAAAELKRA